MTLYTSEVVAQHLDVTERRVRQLRDEGIIREKRPGLYNLVDAMTRYIKYVNAGSKVDLNDERAMDRKLFFHGKRPARVRHQSRKGSRHILRQKPAVRAGVGDEPFFVKTLGIIQSLLCRKSQQTVGIPLKGGQVVQRRRILGFFLALHLLHRDTPLLSAFGKQQFGILLRFSYCRIFFCVSSSSALHSSMVCGVFFFVMGGRSFLDFG